MYVEWVRPRHVLGVDEDAEMKKAKASDVWKC